MAAALGFCYCIHMNFPTSEKQILEYANHPQGETMLVGAAAAEAALFPALAEALLVPMALLQTEHAFRYAFMATLGAVGGAIGGYVIGAILAVMLEPMMIGAGFGDELNVVRAWFATYDVLMAGVGAFAPLPFAIFSIISGLLSGSVVQLVMACLVAKGARYFLLVWFLWRGGPSAKLWVERNFFALSMLIALGMLMVSVGLTYVWKYM